MAKQFAVLGSPIAQSKSPKIHQAAYQILGLDWHYEAFDVDQNDLVTFLATTGANFDGFSLTMPLKELAIRSAVQIDEVARRTQNANTLLKRQDGWWAFNTDVFGIERALLQENLSEVKTAVIVGNGSTARSALVAISQLAPRAELFIAGRNPNHLESFCAYAGSQGYVVRPIENRYPQPDLTVSTLPPGTFDSVIAGYPTFAPTGTLLDVAYNPWPSQAALHWTNAGLPVVNGIHMLIWQALGQIRIFTSGDPAKPREGEDSLAATMLAAAR